jgi:hypothetical protein
VGEGARGRKSDDSAVVTARLIHRFLRDVPQMALIWLGVMVFIGGVGLISGNSTVREMLAFAVGFLPMAVPLSPIIWLRWEQTGWSRGTLAAVAIAMGWFVVTGVPSLLLGAWLAGLVGGD